MSKFKSDNNVWFTRALFVDLSVDRSQAIYALSSTDIVGKDGKNYPSLHRLYVELEDTTEYLFANKYLGGWAHWKTLCSCNFFKPYVEAMREEVSIKLKARCLEALQRVATDPDDKRYVEANKFLLKDALELPKRSIGRPKKPEPSKDIINEERQVKLDLKRLGLN